MYNFLKGVCLLASSLFFAQNCDLQLHIKIVDFHDGKPLSDAAVTNISTQETIYSDLDGNLIFRNLCPETLHFILEHQYCDPSEETIKLVSSEQVVWFLEHHIVQLEDIETAGNQRRQVSTMAETHLHEEEIERASAETLGSVLKTVSGVNGLETGNSIIKPIIHGMHSSRIITLNNGIRQEDMEWGVEHAPNMDLNAFHDIRVIKGAAALRYGGDAVGGIILTEYPLLPKKDTVKGKAGITGLLNGRGGNAFALIQKGFNSKWALQLQGSVKRTGDFRAPDYYITNSGSSQRAVMAEVAYGDFKNKLSASYSFFSADNGILLAAHFGNLIDLADAINADSPAVTEDFSYEIQKPFQQIDHHLAKLTWERRFSGLGKLESTYAFQFNKRQEFDVRTGEVTDLPSMDTELLTHSASLTMSFDKNEKLTLQSGINAMFQDNYSDPVTQNKRLIPDYMKFNGGAFASLSYNPVREWNLNSGVRYDYTHFDTKKYFYKRFWDRMNYNDDFSENIIGDFGNEWLTQFQLNYHNFSGMLGVAYNPTNMQEVLLNYTLSSRPPNPSELFSEGLHHSAVSIELGDVRIQPEKGHKISLNYKRNFDILDGLNLNLLGYYHAVHNFIYQVPTGADYTIRGSFPVWSYRQNDAEFFGFDFDLDFHPTPQWNYQTGFSYVHGTDTENNIPLIHLPPFHWQQEIRFTNPGKLQTFVALNSEYTAKQTRFPDYNFSIDILENGENISKMIDLSTPPSAYFLLNAEAGFTLNSALNAVRITGRIKNIMNTKHRNYLNRFRYFTDETGRQVQLQIIYNF